MFWLFRKSSVYTAVALVAVAIIGSVSPICLAQDLVAAAMKPTGPMVGHTTENEATIWYYSANTPKPNLLIAMVGETSVAKDVRIDFSDIQIVAAESVAIGDLDIPGHLWKFHAKDLLPGTEYIYGISPSGDGPVNLSGRLRTAPKLGQPTKFRLGVTSCMRIGQPQQSWTLFLNDKPDVHLTLGDTQYADTTEGRIQFLHHLRYRNVPEFAKVLANVPTYAMWDDHDYGPNNSDGTASGKEDSLKAWKRIWNNPAAGTDEIPGAFFTFSRGDVDFFVIDGRYHRSPDKAPDDKNKTMLGEAQFNWLIDGLKASKARFKIIASGSTLHHSTADGWRIYTHERHRLFDAIKENQIDGVVYMSGDIHQSLVWEHHESDRVGYPLVEVISSGIANSKTLSYATVDFDTTIDDPTMTVRIVLGNGSLKQEQTWTLSQLSVD